MNENKQKIMRYAELAFKKQKLEKEEGSLSAEDAGEMTLLLQELGMTHEAILEQAAKNLIPDDGEK